MKIVLNTENGDLYNAFCKIAKDNGHEIINAKLEGPLFDEIEKSDGDAYIISSTSYFFQKAIDFIKKANPYIPIVAIIASNSIGLMANANIYMTISEPFDIFANLVMHNITNYSKTFATLQKLTAKIHDKIEFANCTYDPTRRLLYYKRKEIKKLSPKEGSILEVLAINYGEIVKKEVILEKVWRKTDFFAGRSMDVYITYLRNTFKNNKIKLTIKNISGIGLILE